MLPLSNAGSKSTETVKTSQKAHGLTVDVINYV